MTDLFPGNTGAGSPESSEAPYAIDPYRMAYDFEDTLEDPPAPAAKVYRLGSIKGRPLFVAIGWPSTLYRQFGRRYLVAQTAVLVLITAMIAAGFAMFRHLPLAW